MITDLYDLENNELRQSELTTCYNVFGHEFELIQITPEEFKKFLEEVK